MPLRRADRAVRHVLGGARERGEGDGRSSRSRWPRCTPGSPRSTSTRCRRRRRRRHRRGRRSNAVLVAFRAGRLVVGDPPTSGTVSRRGGRRSPGAGPCTRGRTSTWIDVLTASPHVVEQSADEERAQPLTAPRGVDLGVRQHQHGILRVEVGDPDEVTVDHQLVPAAARRCASRRGSSSGPTQIAVATTAKESKRLRGTDRCISGESSWPRRQRADRRRRTHRGAR